MSRLPPTAARWGLWGFAAALCTACPHEASRTALPLTRCRLKQVDHEAQCGTFDVFEDRASRTGRRLSLNIAVVPSLAPSPNPDPVFILAGGPGQAATDIAGALMPAFEQELHHRDLVFVDQRGTGRSHPLRCEAPDGGSDDLGDLSRAERAAILHGCLAGYDADPKLYTTSIAMDDLDEVRAALGYERVNLWGGSYGTRAALVYLRQHGDRVRTVTLDGVAPPGMRLPLSMAADAQRALDLLFEACAQDADCSHAYPHLRAQFDALLERLERAPVKTKLTHPTTGAPQDVTLRKDGFVLTLRGLLYLPEATAVLPLTIDRAAQGDFAPYWAEAQLLSGGFEKGLAGGMFLSVLCAEDAPAIRPEEIGPGTAKSFVGRRLTDDILEDCASWPRGTPPKGYDEPVRSEVPVLLLSGDLDPVTPPRYAEQVAKGLSHSLSLTIPGVGHGTTSAGCVRNIISQFISKGTVDGLDTHCTQELKRPPFFVSFAGPRP